MSLGRNKSPSYWGGFGDSRFSSFSGKESGEPGILPPCVVLNNFCTSDDTVKPLTNHKMTKIFYLPQIMSDPKNKGILFSAFKVEELKVILFS